MDDLFFVISWMHHGIFSQNNSKSLKAKHDSISTCSANATCTHEELFKLGLVKLAHMQSCPLVLNAEWAWASRIHIKAILLSAFLLSSVVSWKACQRNVFKHPRLWSAHSPFDRSVGLSFFLFFPPVQKMIKADSSGSEHSVINATLVKFGGVCKQSINWNLFPLFPLSMVVYI